MSRILMLVLLIVIYLVVDKLMNKTIEEFIMTYSTLSGVAYSLYMMACLGCLFLCFQDFSNIPLIGEHIFLIKVILGLLAMNLVSLLVVCMGAVNPECSLRMEMVKSYKLRHKQKEVQNLISQGTYTLITFRKKLDKISRKKCSKEEKDAMVKKLYEEYQKDFETLGVDFTIMDAETNKPMEFFQKMKDQEDCKDDDAENKDD